MFGTKKPKFKLSFAVNDLSKIPHTSGYCCADISIADSNPSGFRATLSSLKPFSSSSKDIDENELASVSPNSHQSSQSAVKGRSSSRSIHVRTSKVRIHNFKCHFNFSMSCNMKFALKKKDNMVGDKYLAIRVLYYKEKHSRHESFMELGEVKLNLTEYLNFGDPVTAKYLLQNSKINSILTLTISLEELPADFEFHTQLRIDDTKHSQIGSSTNLCLSKASENGTKSYNVPQFSRQAVFGGLNGVINPLTASASANGSGSVSVSGRESSDPSFKSLSENDEGEIEEKESSRHDRLVSTTGTVSKANRTHPIGTSQIDDVRVDPIIGSLYRKILESSWDPDLHVLLKLTPQKVVDDIFEQPRDSTKIDNILQHYRNLRPKDEDEGVKNAEGLFVESKFKSNLTSWSVSWT